MLRQKHIIFLILVWTTIISLRALFLSPPLRASDETSEVDKLASTNSPFVIRGKPGRQKARKGEVYDASESDRIQKQIATLTSNREAVWPELVSHLTDERHAGVVGIDAGYPRNWQVSEVCLNLIGEALSAPYYRHMPGTKANFHRFHIPVFAQQKEKLQKWCEERKGRKLYELQIEACEWALNELDSSDIRERDIDSQQKIKIAQQIRDEIENLKKSRAAVRPPANLDIH